MFGFLKNKKVNDPALLKQITKDGVAYAGQRFSSILMRDFLTTNSLAYNFVMQELDGARQGNDLSIKFVENSGIAKSEYEGSLNQDIPELDMAQEWMQMLTSKLYPRMDIIVSLRLEIIKNIMKRYGIGASNLSKETSFEQLKKLAEEGNAAAQVAVALTYREGVLTSQNYYKAFEWLEKAAKQGDVNAQAELVAIPD